MSETGTSWRDRGTDPRAALCNALRLMMVTDREITEPRDLRDVVCAAIDAGVTSVQLREKTLPPRDVLPFARWLREKTSEAGILFLVNDRLDLALEVGADGVHVGPEDLPVADARRLSPPGFVVGYSTSVPAEAVEAVAQGADYIGCGPVFGTSSKDDAGVAIGVDGLRGVVDAVSFPVIGIGGITADAAESVYVSGAAGCAVISALANATEMRAAVAAFLAPWVAAEGGSDG